MVYLPNTKSIQIAGGGIAGLTAAIQLKRSKFHPVVFEKESRIGDKRHGDYEGLENWIFTNKMSSFFSQAGFDFNQVSSYPISKFMIHTNSFLPFTIKQNRPFFYMVRRGSSSKDLDTQLFKQCEAVGVQFELGVKAPEDCHILATGTRKAAAYIHGINFITDREDQVHLLLGHEFAPKGYAYLIILNGQGTLATAYKKQRGKELNLLNNCLDYFQSYGIVISNGSHFASRGSFSLPFGSLVLPYEIGEAGGYQDYLFGFGIRMSMMSGRAAALSIIGRKKEAKALINDLNQKMRLSFVNRILYERLNDDQMASFAKKLSKAIDPISLLSSAYMWNLKNILRWITMKKRYEIRPT